MLIGSAIQVDPESGIASLKVDFSLPDRPATERNLSLARAARTRVSRDTTKLSVRTLLYHLWHEAELTAWTARWTGSAIDGTADGT